MMYRPIPLARPRGVHAARKREPQSPATPAVSSRPPQEALADTLDLRIVESGETAAGALTEHDRAQISADVAGTGNPHALALPAHYLAHGRELRDEFDRAAPQAAVGERLLEHLAAAEVPIALALVDAEAALVALLHKTLCDPTVATELARLLKETIGLSGAVRRRIESSLSAAAGLRAQRQYLAASGGIRGV